MVKVKGDTDDSNTKNPNKSEIALREEKILEFWREKDVFNKTLQKESPKGNYVFYDGPPFATGQMHYGHILGSTAKDVIGRYQTMQGFHVPRKWGWDCHGLPIENIVEAELGIAGHNEIEEYGIDKFVKYARGKVLQYDSDWRKGIERIGRWVDFDGGYKTMDNTFIESVWWAFSEFYKKDLIYEGVRVLAYCARCETPIANSEIAMDNSYKDIADISIYVKFELSDEPGTYLLAWTTTPWTLPGNTAIAVNKDIDYVKVSHEGVNYILAKETVGKVVKGLNEENFATFKGIELVGKKYKPVFPYYKDVDMPNKENIYKVWHADFVTADQGTGLAHEAPAFGEDDMNLAKMHNIPWIIHVDETGRFKKEVKDFAGLKVKPKDTNEDKDAHLRTDIEVIKYLQGTGAYFAKEKITHSYPHCMRCDTPIIYYALPSWFIDIQKNKKSILKDAQAMTWVPSHLKDGRFKNITESAPDWNISRNRYWASPLPIWIAGDGEKIVVDSLDTIKKHTKKSGNKYFIARHGEALSNKEHFIDCGSNEKNTLTKKGQKQVEDSALKHKKKNFDLIFSSPIVRTKQSAEIIAEIVNYPKDEIIYDERLKELDMGKYDGMDIQKYHDHFAQNEQKFDASFPEGESHSDVFRRMGEFLYELESKYEDKNILIVSHGDPLMSILLIAKGFQLDKVLEEEESVDYMNTGEIRELDFVPLPHDDNYALDLHRPYIDDVVLVKKDPLIAKGTGMANKEFYRTPEVLDCWFESGSMPFAQDHYPFDNPKWKKNNFPAGFVAEYIAQTRTWFYYTHVISSTLFDHAPFKNVVTTGTLRAEDGQKMSKSKKNYPDPWIFIDLYGVDALRMYLMSSPLMKGEDANFSEKAVQEISSKIINRFLNTLAFYELYRDKSAEETNLTFKPKNILDLWIISKLGQVTEEVTRGMEAYDMSQATDPIDKFVDDLSTWYLRRSRDRIKDGDKEAKQVLYVVLKSFAILIAPFMPFTAEYTWQILRKEKEPESIHLASWPDSDKHIENIGLIDDMEKVRRIVSEALQLRQKEGVRVRQPLASLGINFALPKPEKEFEEIIKDELNVKSINQDKGLEGVMLDFEITQDLKEEGVYREFLRAIQDMRKKMKLTPKDKVELVVDTNETGEELLNKFKKDLKKVAVLKNIYYEKNKGDEIKVDEFSFRVTISV